jgi:hypothetical protein
MPSLIHTARDATQLVNVTPREVPVAMPKARAGRRVRELAGAELKCCAPLDSLPRLSATPASARDN